MSERQRRPRPDQPPGDLRGTGVGAAPVQEADQAPHESHRRYQALFGQMLEGVAYCRMLFDEAGQPADWIYLEVNSAFEALTGLRGAAGKRVTQLIPGIREANPELFEIYGRVAQTGVPEQFESYLPDLERWFLVKAFRPQKGDFAAVFENITERKRLDEALRDADGTTTGVVTAALDITARHEAEQAVRRSEKEFHSIFDSMGDGVAIVGLDGTFLEVNQVWCERLGYSREELLAMSMSAIRSTEPPALIKERIERVMQGGVQVYETTHIRRDGTEIPIEAVARRIEFRGSPAILTSARDLTERRKAEQAIRQSETRFRTIFDYAADVILMVDPAAGRFVEVNKAACDMLGYSREELLALRPVEINAPEAAKGLPARFQAVVERGSAAFETTWMRRDGVAIPVETRGAMIDLEGRRIVLVVTRDVSERKRAEEALRASAAELRAVLDATPFPVALVDSQDDRIDYWSRSALTLFGHTAPTAGEWYQMAYPDPDYRREVIDRWKPALEKARLSAGSVNTGEYRVTCRDGSVRICEIHAAFLAEKLVVTFNDITERKRQAAERDRLAAVVEESPDGMVITDPDFRITYANAAYANSVGRAPSELVGRGAAEVAAIGLDETALADLVRTVTPGRPWLREVDHRDRNGAVHRSEASVTPTYDANGAISSWIGIFRDVTELRRGQAERDRLAAAVEQSPDGIVMTDPAHRITYANAAFATGVGREPSELVGRGILEVVGRVVDATTLATLVEVAGAGTSWLDEASRRRPDGTLGRIDIRVTPHLAVDGKIEGYVTILRDVTEMRRGEAERTRLAAAVEQSADAVVITDADARIEYVNPAFEQASGYTRDEVLGQNPRILKSGVHGPAFYAAMWAALTGGHSFTADMTNRRKDGSLFQDESVISPVLDADGTTTSYVEVARDVTRERAIEAAWERQARERATVANSLAYLKAGPTPKATAEAICRQVVSLAGLTSAALYYFTVGGQAMPLAFVRADEVPVPLRRLPARRSERLRERAEAGPWVEAWIHRPWHPYDRLYKDLGVQAVAYAPVRHDGSLVGLLAIASAGANATPELAEFLPALIEVATVAGPLVGPAVADLTQVGRVRARILKAIDEGAFHPVFQPIIDLASRKVVGYEALTRFDSGQSPDLCFADAWAVDMGPALEIATLGAAVAAAPRLPAGFWLSLNVSPRLLVDPDRLSAVLWPAECPIVLEITEHEIIEDYPAVRAAIRALGHDVRLAVDDAGAGIANFGHIIELRPNIVKLDISLVRGVNADLGRQAMVVGMRHFAAEAGCRLLAEGVETQAEADTLLALGVDLGQGYLFGHPERAEEWVSAPPSSVSRRAKPQRGKGH